MTDLISRADAIAKLEAIPRLESGTDRENLAFCIARQSAIEIISAIPTHPTPAPDIEGLVEKLEAMKGDNEQPAFCDGLNEAIELLRASTSTGEI